MTAKNKWKMFKERLAESLSNGAPDVIIYDLAVLAVKNFERIVEPLDPFELGYLFQRGMRTD